MKIGILDKVFYENGITDEGMMVASDEAECVAIAAGWWFATKNRAQVYVSADGFMNCLNFITSWLIPDDIEMDFTISIGRRERPHYVASEMVPKIIKLLKKKNEPEKISYRFVQKK